MRILFTISILICTIGLFGQNQPVFTQYVFNNYALNPAVGGSFPCSDFKFGRRAQWDGLEGAPTTSFFTFNTAINRKFGYMKSFNGVGAMYIADEAGPYSNRALYFSYARHFHVNRTTLLSLGSFVGVRSYVYGGAGVITNTFDPIVNTTSSVLQMPEVHPGAWLYSKKFFAGLAVFNLYPFKLKSGGNAIGSPSNITPMVVATYGKIIKSKRYYYKFIPSTQLRFTPNAPPSVDFNFLWEIQNKITFGASYRSMSSVAAMLQVKMLHRFKFGYSVGYGVGSISGLKPFSHEIMLSFQACKDLEALKEEHACPAYY